MRHLLYRLLVGVLVLTGLGSDLRAAEPPKLPGPSAKILILGTFHFKDAGLDGYKPEHDIDIMSAERQKEVEALVKCLSEFHPTKVAIEAPLDFDDTLNARYQRYLDGQYELRSNEIYQLGFRLAKTNGLTRMYPVDAGARYYEPFVDPEEYAGTHGQAEALSKSETPWDQYYLALYAYEDELKTKQPLRATFLQMNDPARLMLGHGHYLIGTFKAGVGDEYPGADARTAWYNRNLRIFANLTRIVDMPADRLVLIIGAGHVPILRQAVQASPQYELVEVRDLLGDCREQ